MIVDVNGVSRTAVAPLWSSSDSTVATVTDDGMVTAKHFGEATLRAVAQGIVQTRTLRVLPNYNGAWSGGVLVESCEACPSFYPVGFSHRISVTFTHGGEDLTGAVSISGYPIPVAGRIDPATGGFTVQGSLSQPPPFTFTESVVVVGDIDSEMRLHGSVTYTTLSPARALMRGRLLDLPRVFATSSR